MGRTRIYASEAEKQAAYRQRHTLRNNDTVTLALPIATHDGDTDDSYTPKNVITAARSALGVIDLDPASSLFAQRTVQALQWCGRDHPDEDRRDGLAISWAGRVWCNPPFSGGNLLRFTEKLIAAYHAGDVTAACLITRADVSTRYSQLLRVHATASCWPCKRINFKQPYRRSGVGEGSPNFTTIIWYLGRSPGRFVTAFASIGDTR